MAGKQGQLGALISVGPAISRDFEFLGVRRLPQLARRNPGKMYEKLCEATGRCRISVAWTYYERR